MKWLLGGYSDSLSSPICKEVFLPLRVSFAKVAFLGYFQNIYFQGAVGCSHCSLHQLWRGIPQGNIAFSMGEGKNNHKTTKKPPHTTSQHSMWTTAFQEQEP